MGWPKVIIEHLPGPRHVGKDGHGPRYNETPWIIEFAREMAYILRIRGCLLGRNGPLDAQNRGNVAEFPLNKFTAP